MSSRSNPWGGSVAVRCGRGVLRLCLAVIGVSLALAGWADPPDPVEDDRAEAGDAEWEGVEVYEVFEQALDEGEALEEVARQARALGWEVRRKANGAMVFVPSQRWAGRATLRDGVVKTRKPAVKWDPKNGPFAFYVTNPRKIEARNHAFLEAMRPALDTLREAGAQRRFVEMLHQLPGRLDALWSEGTPLSGEVVLLTVASRRAAILDYWSTRLATPEGRRVMDAVEAWWLDVVQSSPEAATQAELEAAEARRLDGRRLPR